MRRAALLLLALLILPGCGGSDQTSTPPQSPPASGVRELANILELRSDFEMDAGKARVILLFSPT